MLICVDFTSTLLGILMQQFSDSDEEEMNTEEVESHVTHVAVPSQKEVKICLLHVFSLSCMGVSCFTCLLLLFVGLFINVMLY